MMIVKSAREIELIKKSCAILVEVRKILKGFIKPGISLNQLDKIAEEEILKRNGKPAFKGYGGFPATLCLSVNDCVVHGIPSNYVLQDGDILSVDMGVIYNGYFSDSCVTFPVGNITPETQKLLDVTKASLMAGIAQVKGGVLVRQISRAIEEYVKPFGYGIVREYTGHGCGNKLHEDPVIPNYEDISQTERLKPGMVICIEPMINMGTAEIYVAADQWTVRTKDNKPSAHFEHQVLVLPDGYEILTLDKE